MSIAARLEPYRNVSRLSGDIVDSREKLPSRWGDGVTLTQSGRGREFEGVDTSSLWVACASYSVAGKAFGQDLPGLLGSFEDCIREVEARRL